MIVRDGDGFRVEGPANLRTVPELLDRGRELFTAPVSRVDLGGVVELDSAALSLLLEWLRDALAAGRRIIYFNLPANLKVLAELYGVLELLPRAHAT